MVKTPLLLRKLVASVRWRGKKFRSLRENTGVFGSVDEDENLRRATGPSMVRFGKLFLTTFPVTKMSGKKRTHFTVTTFPSNYESPVSVGIAAIKGKGAPAERLKNLVVAEALLTFERNAVVICLHGRRRAQPELERFRLAAGMPWAEFLVQKVEAHARACGFRQARIVVPETMHYYQTPFAEGRHATLEERRKIRANMKALYEGVADSMGYKKEGLFFVKRL